MSVIGSNILAGASGQGGGYTIDRSVRLRSSASAYLSRTPASAGNRKTWTWSGWVKRGALGALQVVFQAGTDGNNYLYGCYFNSSDKLVFSDGAQSGGSICARTTDAVFRDPSAWYHIVVQFNASSTSAKIYVNGTEQSATGTQPSNVDYSINNTVEHRIGRAWGMNTSYFDGYLTEINFIDGQALTPSSFGENDAVTGVWKPKKYVGTYGTNGFYLNFSDNTSTTTLGHDTSGNGNNWTANNISLTSGATYDSMTDVPTLTSETAGNYAVLNSVNKALYQPTISDGNLRVTPTTVQYQNVFSTISQTSGKWYAEVVVNGTPNSANMIGISSATEQNYLTTNAGLVGITSTGYGYFIYNGSKYTNGSASSYGNSIASGDVVGIALDLDNGKVFFSKNGTWQASGDPVAGTNAAFTGLTSSLGFFISSSSYSGGATSFDHNFGQRPFAYTPPTGFKALNTFNLPAGTITTSGSFTGNASTDGPFVYLNGVPTAMTINGNAVTFGTHADKTANGFKVRSSSSSYNASGSNTYSITTTGAKFKYANAQGNP